jgi:small subunit ribosomal protein S15
LTPKSAIFDREQERKPGDEEDKDSDTTLMRVYSYEDLGKRLGDLRPAGAVKDGKEWFSLQELQGRIAKLVQLEKQEARLGEKFGAIRSCFASLAKPPSPAKPPEKPLPGKGLPLQTILSLGTQMTPDYTGLPPQEELVERVRLPFPLPSFFFSCS